MKIHGSGMKAWLMGFFPKRKQQLLKKIPLCRRVAEDVLTWPHTQDGQYTCKSGYRFLKEEAELGYMQEASVSNSTLWKGIWFLQIPNKVKNLLWRACQNAMPIKATLVWRTIIDDPFCDRCHETHETPLHALWLCKELDSVWESSVHYQSRQNVNFVDFKELLSWILTQTSEVELFAMMAWGIWT